MQTHVIEKTFRLAGDGHLVAQFAFITSGILYIIFPDVGLQMEAHRNQLRIQNNTIIYTDRLDYGEQRAHWALTLEAEDMKEFKDIISQINSHAHLVAKHGG